jgi:hypothetical protein
MPTSATVSFANYFLTKFTFPLVSLNVVGVMMLATRTALFYSDTIFVFCKVVKYAFNAFAIIHLIFYYIILFMPSIPDF